MTEDVQSAASFGSQLCKMLCPEDFADYGVAYIFETANLFQWLAVEIDSWIHLTSLLERQGENVRFV